MELKTEIQVLFTPLASQESWTVARTVALAASIATKHKQQDAEHRRRLAQQIRRLKARTKSIADSSAQRAAQRKAVVNELHFQAQKLEELESLSPECLTLALEISERFVKNIDPSQLSYLRDQVIAGVERLHSNGDTRALLATNLRSSDAERALAEFGIPSLEDPSLKTGVIRLITKAGYLELDWQRDLIDFLSEVRATLERKL